MRSVALAVVVLLALCGCGSKPRAPDWQMNAHDALERYVTAYLKGDSAVASVEFDRARRELTGTGQVALVARAELTRCAAQVASLVFDNCDGFERLRADAPAAERAYADYLDGSVAPADVPLLPEQHRRVAEGREDASSLQAIQEPLARLVAAGVLMRSGRASPEVLATAAETASQQGWRRSLLAWLGVQLLRAERSGASAEVDRLKRRIALVGGER